MVAAFHPSALWLLLLMASFTLTIHGAASPDWTDCPSSCRCKWTSGKKSALCKEAGFTTIPGSLSSDMQVLDLSNNNIPYLTKDAFRAVGLINLQRIFLHGSRLRQVNRDAFKDLIILIEVDLSDNSLVTLHPDTFTGNDRLRELRLNANPITELRSSQFPQLLHLRTLELQDCQLRHIHKDAFINIVSLETLNLKNNQLKQLSERALLPVSKLKTLKLDGNPWQCDCELRGFRNWLLNSNLYSTKLTCNAENDVLFGRLWEEVKPLEFACAPQVNLSEQMVQEEVGGNVSFRCHIRGDPEPEVTWLFNGRPIGSGNLSHEQVFLIDEEQGRREKWTNLSILNLTEHDGGEYSCLARNSRGVSSRNVTLSLPQVVTATTLSKTESWLLWAGLLAGGVAALFAGLVAVICTCCVCGKQRRRRKHRRKNKLKSSISFTDQEKKLLDVSITTTERPSGSFEALSIQPEMEMMESQSIPMELCDPPVHITIESHAEAMGVGGGYPSGLTVFPPPPEFSSSILPSGAYGNIFISVSVSQEPSLTDPQRYPDLLDLPHRPAKGTSVSVAAGPDTPYTGNVASFVTLPRRVRNKDMDPMLRVGPQYDNMGPRVTAGGSSTLSLPDVDLDEELDYIPPPPLPPLCSPMTSEYVSL